MNQKKSYKKPTSAETEKAKFDHFYAQHAAAVFGWILQFVDDKIAAEQILVMSFCKMWKLRDTWKEDEREKSLFYLPFIIQASKDFYDKNNIEYHILNNGSLSMKFVTEKIKEETSA